MIAVFNALDFCRLLVSIISIPGVLIIKGIYSSVVDSAFKILGRDLNL